jgi:hypothetical protein
MMQNILQRWQGLPREDLFQFWQKETGLKKELRQARSGYRELKIQNEMEYVFLRQSMAYGEHKPAFLRILFYNMDCLPVQNALLGGPLPLCHDFLQYLPAAIAAEKPSPQHLQFLINLYREDFHRYFETIVSSLGTEECDYLLGRTANNRLRKLLKDRYSRLNQEQSEGHYGLLQSDPEVPPYLTLYGDKIDLIRQTIRLLALDQETLLYNPMGCLKAYLEAADQLFMVGMLSDCLTLLHEVYQQWQPRKTDFLTEDNNGINRSINRILGKSLAVYALLNSSSACQYSLDIYHHYFPELLLDNTSRLYLQLYQNLQMNRQGNPQYSFIEMTDVFMQLGQREDDELPRYFRDRQDLSPDILARILEELSQDLTVSPPKALVTMEILRALARANRIIMSKQLASQLLRNYLDLYRWIPSPRFLNHDIYRQLAELVDDELRNEAKQFLTCRSKYTNHAIRELYKIHPDKFKGENNIILRQMLLGSFLGVLS